jgi:hypothetical protein
MTKLRDWQKKASVLAEAAATKELFKAQCGPRGISLFEQMYLKGHSSRDAEIDLLIQIIEKQSKALGFYCDRENWYGPETHDGGFRYFHKIDRIDCDVASVTGNLIGGSRARTTQDEVQQIVERLIDDRR